MLVVLAGGKVGAAKLCMARLRERGLEPQRHGHSSTGSTGLAEPIAQGCAGGSALVRIADQRMDAAQRAGCTCS